MRLINARTLELVEFPDERIVEYAILSHRWEDGEVTFKEMEDFKGAAEKKLVMMSQYIKNGMAIYPGVQDFEVAPSKPGFNKIDRACRQAIKDGYYYIWVDTCCINKDSSAELSEAINSMYRLYESAAVCYAFLSDVQASEEDEKVEQEIKESLWFTRGWTLQELLASRVVHFFNSRWGFLGTKHTLTEVLTLCTGIDGPILRKTESPFDRSVAQRMSWASQRVTTRIEDIAYCLLGIFDINMPMLYGEGAKAFVRLQEEIIKQTDDHSIFAWPLLSKSQVGLFAQSPAAFVGCGNIETVPPPPISSSANIPSSSAMSFAICNRGLSINLFIFPYLVDTYLACLNCYKKEEVSNKSRQADSTDEYPPYLGILLRRLPENDQYIRLQFEGQKFICMRAKVWDGYLLHAILDSTVRLQPAGLTEVHVRQRLSNSSGDVERNRFQGFRITTLKTLQPSLPGHERHTDRVHSWDSQKRIISLETGELGPKKLYTVAKPNHKVIVIHLGFDFGWNPICFIGTSGDGEKDKQFFSQEIGSWKSTLPAQRMETSRSGDVHTADHVTGLWLLRGDRLKGFHAVLNVEGFAYLQIMRGRFRNKLVWDVYLEYDDDRDGLFRSSCPRSIPKRLA